MESVDPLLTQFLPEDVKTMFFPYVSVELWALLLNLLIGFGLALVIGAHFRKYASAFTNRQDFSRLFPMLMLTIILIISVVKASLALALGLVGALSIVRFRTPIKEPEELIYLFLNIGVAVSLGAGQTLAAVMACVVILPLVTWVKIKYVAQYSENGLFLMLSYSSPDGVSNEMSVSSLKKILEEYVDRLELRRFDTDSRQFDATFFVSIKDAGQIDAFTAKLQEEYSGINISLLEQHNIAGV